MQPRLSRNITSVKAGVDAGFVIVRFVADKIKEAGKGKIAFITRSDAGIEAQIKNTAFTSPELSLLQLKHIPQEASHFNKRQFGSYLESLATFKALEGEAVIFASCESAARASIPAVINTRLNCYKLSYDDLIANLSLFGYERVSCCTDIYQFAVRGSVVDFTRCAAVQGLGKDELCYRVDFLSDSPEAIFEFDIASQLRTAKVPKNINRYSGEPEFNSPYISPVCEVLNSKQTIIAAKQSLQNICHQDEIEMLDHGIVGANIAANYLQYFYQEPLSTLYDYLCDDDYVIFEAMPQEDIDKAMSLIKNKPNIITLSVLL